MLSAHHPFTEFSKQFNPKNIVKNFPSSFTSEFTLKGKNISISSLSSSIFSNLNTSTKSREPDYGELAIGEYQIVKVLEKRNKNEIDLSLVLTHHPIDYLANWDRRIVENYFSKYFDFHFYGHSHYQRFEQRTNQYNHLNSVQSGAIYSDYDDDNVYTQLTWTLNDDKINILERIYNKSSMEWGNYDDMFTGWLQGWMDSYVVLTSFGLFCCVFCRFWC